jgi:hypothetical protein
LSFIENLEQTHPIRSVYDPQDDLELQLQSDSGDFGKSMWDNKSMTEHEFQNFQDIRANN